ncbi:MAG: helix-turn-helix domain-containing protein [Actinomycetota bacterium]|nr:helix-turn-helix domain-containing protein [Actinomycetota bacterium]
MVSAQLVSTIRAEARLSLRALAEAAGVATSTVHRIERGEMEPTVEMLGRIAEAAGMRLQLDARPDYAASLVGLGRSIAQGRTAHAGPGPVRMAAELVHRFRRADTGTQLRMITARPAPTGDSRWDAFLGALGEWLAVTAGLQAPSWTQDSGRFLSQGWWITPMQSLQAWEYAGSPVSFKIRGVYVHRDSLVNV